MSRRNRRRRPAEKTTAIAALVVALVVKVFDLELTELETGAVITSIGLLPAFVSKFVDRLRARLDA